MSRELENYSTSCSRMAICGWLDQREACYSRYTRCEMARSGGGKWQLRWLDEWHRNSSSTRSFPDHPANTNTRVSSIPHHHRVRPHLLELTTLNTYHHVSMLIACTLCEHSHSYVIWDLPIVRSKTCYLLAFWCSLWVSLTVSTSCSHRSQYLTNYDNRHSYPMFSMSHVAVVESFTTR